MKTTFFSIVMKYFQYLSTDYDFKIKKLEESERHPDNEGRVEFESPTTFVTVSSEQWTVSAHVGRVKDNKYYYFLDPRTIYEYFALTEYDKQLVCSQNPEDDREARILLNRIALLHKKNDSSNHISSIEKQLDDYSNWLRQYAEPFLRGDFSRWLEIYEYRIARQLAEHIRSGKDKYVLQFVRLDENGKPVHAKKRVFQASFEYLENLRKEYQKGH